MKGVKMFDVLVVDDSDVIRMMIARTMRASGAPIGSVHEAANGKEALRLLERHPVDLVLTDINMPIMDGATLIEHMRATEHACATPVVVISTGGASQDISALLDRGVSAWVRKPFTPLEIRHVLDSVLPEPHAADPTILDGAVALVCETFAFAFAEPTVESGRVERLETASGELLAACIRFAGAASGELTVVAPRTLCVEFASSALGCESDDPAAAVAAPDVLGEFANVMAGRVATAVEPDRAIHLSPPEVSRWNRDEWDWERSAARSRVYLVEDAPLLVLLRVHRAPRPPAG